MANGIVIPSTDYKYGFSKPENYVFKSRRGLDKSVVEQIRKGEEKANDLLLKRDEQLKVIGNLMHSAVPNGKDDSENVEIKTWGKKPEFSFLVFPMYHF